MDRQELSIPVVESGIDTSRAGEYRHFKGGRYVVHGTITDASDDSVAVLYSNEVGRLFVRPLDNFFEMLPDGRARFEAL